MKPERISNHERAPLTAEWVTKMRELFGPQVKVLHVKEGDFEIGEPQSKEPGFSL